MKKNQSIFLKLSYKQGGWFILGIVTAFASSQILVTGNSMIAGVIDLVLAGEAIVFSEFIVKLLGMVILGSLFTFFCTIAKNQFAIMVQNDFKNVAASKILKLEYKYFDEKGSGSILNKLVSDLNEVGRLFSETLPECLMSLIVFLTITIYMLQIEVTLTAVVLATYPIMLAISHFLSNRLMRLAKMRRNQLDERTEIAFDGINGMMIGRSYNLFEPMSKRLFAVIERVFENEAHRTKLTSASYVLQEVISWIPRIGCYVFALFEVLHGDITVGEMIAFVALLDRVTMVIGEFPFYINDFKECQISLKRLEEICNEPDEPSGTLELIEKEETCQQGEKIIEFEQVNFSYDGERKVLKDLTFDVLKGSVVALVGASGQGKSTIFQIICGFYRQQSGQYKLHGRPFEAWNIEAARREIALVSQNAFLFPETIEKNIAYGKPGATREEIINACQMANIHDFIMSLPNGYDTIVGERGNLISGGERQRIAIARAFLKNAPILLLDEPTSAVDVKTEAMIQEAIRRISKDKTVLIIAHRLSTIQSADEILVFDQGRLVENGTHEELLVEQGIYAHLYGKEYLEEGVHEQEA